MTVNPVDMQVILPQTGQVNKISRGLQFQQQVEQQILGQQVQQELRDQEHQVKKATHIEHNRIDNENRGKGGSGQDFSSGAKKTRSSAEEKSEEEAAAVGKDANLGNVLDIKI